MVLLCLSILCTDDVDFAQHLLRTTRGSGLKVLGELQALALVIGTQPFAITFRRRIGQPLEDQPANDLAMIQDEGNFP